MKLQSRLIINQAGGIIENAGLCLHPHFGFPMIPGSAVKGIARAAAIRAIRDAQSNEEKTRLLTGTALVFGWCSQDWSAATDKTGSFISDFRYAADGAAWKRVWEETARSLLRIVPAKKDIPGDEPLWAHLPDFGGLVSFLPAFPAPDSEITVVPDVVNCHHPEYYRNGTINKARDTENPVPNFFPAVEAGLSFAFVLAPVRGVRLKRAEAISDDFKPVAAAVEWLETGLTDHGAGAKTNAGYGWFEPEREGFKEPPEIPPQNEPVPPVPPEELAIERYAGLDESLIKFEMREITKLDEPEQRGLLIFLTSTEKGRNIWKSARKKTKRPKDRDRVVRIREAAERWGVELP